MLFVHIWNVNKIQKRYQDIKLIPEKPNCGFKRHLKPEIEFLENAENEKIWKLRQRSKKNNLENK